MNDKSKYDEPFTLTRMMHKLSCHHAKQNRTVNDVEQIICSLAKSLENHGTNMAVDKIWNNKSIWSYLWFCCTDNATLWIGCSEYNIHNMTTITDKDRPGPWRVQSHEANVDLFLNFTGNLLRKWFFLNV